MSHFSGIAAGNGDCQITGEHQIILQAPVCRHAQLTGFEAPSGGRRSGHRHLRRCDPDLRVRTLLHDLYKGLVIGKGCNTQQERQRNSRLSEQALSDGQEEGYHETHFKRPAAGKQ